MERYEKIKLLYLKKGYNIVELDCKYVNDADSIFKLFSLSLKFPKYLEWSWNTFFNNINNLSWLKSKNSVILIKNIENIMQADFFRGFALCLIDAHYFWKNRGVHFDSIIFTSKINNNNISKTLENLSKREYIKIKRVEQYEKIKNLYVNKLSNIIELDGNKISSENDLFDMFLAKLKFPSYFGYNWDAFWDCVTDMSWTKVKNSVILIKNIENIIEKYYFETFIHVLIDAHEWWVKENVIFDLFIFTNNNISITILENLKNKFSHHELKGINL